MSNLVADAPPQSPSSPADSRSGVVRRLIASWDLLAVVLLVVATVPPMLFSPQTLHIVWRPGLFDDSWVLDTSFKASRGIWFGRDVAFNWGPLFQWLSSAPSRWMGISIGAIYETYNMLPLWVGFLLTYFGIRLLLPEQPAWKRFVLIILMSVYWSPFDLRGPLCCFAFAAFLRGWYAIRSHRIQPLLFGSAAALLCVLAFLLKADAGVYSVAALMICLGCIALEDWKSLPWRQCAMALGAFAILSAILVLFVNCLLATAFDFRFWRESIGFVSGFRWSAAAQMASADGTYLFASLLGGTAVFVLRRVVLPREGETVVAARPGFLLGAFVFSVLTLQSALVRGDHNHIQFAAFPMMFLAGVAVFSFRARIMSLAGVAAAIVASALSGGPMITPATARRRYVEMRHPVTTCPSGYSELDHACYPERLVADIHQSSDYLQQHTRPQDRVIAFPFQYVFAVAARRDVADGVEQSFLAADPYLRKLNVDGLIAAAAPAGLYFPDMPPNGGVAPRLGFPIDGVPNFTRSPEMWFWLFRHYRSDVPQVPGIVPLLKDDSRDARISMTVLPLDLPKNTFRVNGPAAVLDLGAPNWPAGADFLRLRLKVDYGTMWKLRKPARLQLEITRADYSRELKTFVVEPNVATDVWFYPWQDANLGGYFADNELQWRNGSRSPIVGLRLMVSPFDWVSQMPESITLDAADAIHFSLNSR